MSDKMSKMVTGAGTGLSNKPVPMKLFATWEVDRTPSNCIPRLCSLTLSRIVVLRPLGNDLASISIAVKMQSSKRILRSIELMLPPHGLLDTSLELTFSLQYPHFIKRDGNRLHVLLQRRKRYKNRTMLGFKTLAEGVIRMDQVLQKQMDLELDLNADSGGKDKGVGPVARINVLGLSSTPVDQEHKPERDRDFSDDEDEFSSGEEEPVDLSDSEPLRKLPHRHNLKQRFISLLKRFKVADTEGGRGAALANNTDIQALFQELESLSCDEDSTGEQDTMSISSTPKPSLRPFFSSSRSLLDNNGSNSATACVPGSVGGHYFDNPFSSLVGSNLSNTAGSITLANNTYVGDDRNCSGSDGNADLCYSGTDYEAHSDPQTGSPPRCGGGAGEKVLLMGGRLKSEPDTSVTTVFESAAASVEKKTKLFRTSTSGNKKKHSLSVGSEVLVSTTPESITARKSFLETVARILPLEEPTLPDTVALVAGPEPHASSIAARLAPTLPRLLQPVCAPEVRAILSTLFAKITKHCNSCGKPATPVRLLLVGGDQLVGWMLRPYVELLSSRPSEWVGYTRVYIVPLGSSAISRHIAAVDPGYSALFGPTDNSNCSSTTGSITTNTTTPSSDHLPLKGEELAQRIQRYLSGGPAAPLTQLPLAEAMLTCQDDSSSSQQLFIPFVNEVRVGPADSAHSLSVDLDELVGGSGGAPALTPPSSPNVQVRESPWEPLELQLDYWQLPSVKVGEKTDKTGKSEGKTSFKGLFRGIQASPGLNVAMQIANKEKKQKIMRLGKKKDKEEARSHCVESISRLICSAKASNVLPMRVLIDGAEWNGVKFFQLSNAWQTHVKYLSVALTGVPLAASEP